MIGVGLVVAPWFLLALVVSINSDIHFCVLQGTMADDSTARCLQSTLACPPTRPYSSSPSLRLKV